MDYSVFYGLSCYAAAIAVVFEIFFLVGSAALLFKPIIVLASDRYRNYYGALYSDLKSYNKIELATTMVHIIRISVLIPALVFLTDYPLMQSVAFLTSAGLAILWDLVVRPYEGVLLTAQMLVMDVAKVAAGVGYVFLTISGQKKDVASGLSSYEIGVFLGGVSAGFVLATIQQIRLVYRSGIGIIQSAKIVPEASDTGRLSIPGFSLSQNSFRSPPRGSSSRILQAT